VVLAAEGALEVGELHHRHGRVGGAERDPVLWQPSQRLHLGGDPARGRGLASGLVPRRAACDHRKRNDHRRHERQDTEPQSHVRSSSSQGSRRARSKSTLLKLGRWI
jgi:hypothetical protein